MSISETSEAAVRVNVRLLGAVEVVLDGERVRAFDSPRLQRFLGLIALRREPQHRSRLAFELWPDSSEAQARTNLRKLLHELRRSIPDFEQMIEVDNETVQLTPDSGTEVDVRRFREAAAVGDLELAARVYTGDLLPACYDDWILEERDRLRSECHQILLQLAEEASRRDDHEATIRHSQRVIEHEPTDETAARLLIEAYLASGDRAGALRAYHRCVETLERELMVPPGEAITTLYRRMRTDAESSAAPMAETGEAIGESPFVGRSGELEQLLDVWSRCREGRAHVVLVEGEAGIGKSRLAAELGRRVRAGGDLVASARAFEAAGRLPWAPVIDLLRSDDLRENLDSLEPVWKAELARLLPELAGAGAAPATGGGDMALRYRLFDAVLRGLIGGRPTVLVVDDLQWCDSDTIEMIGFVVRARADSPVLVVGTVRPDEVSADHPLGKVVDALGREMAITSIPLSPLDEASTQELAIRLGSSGGIDAEQATRLWRETEGNPLFVIESLRAGVDTDSQPMLTPTIRSVLLGRLGQLSDDARRTTDAAAVIGRPFSIDLMVSVSGLSEDDVIDSLDELWRRRIVCDQGLAYDFSHDKLRAVALEAVSPARRRSLHRAVAEALAESPDLDAVAAQLAAHYDQAGMVEPAVAAYRRAGARAVEVSALDEALTMFRRALTLLAELPPSSGRDSLELDLRIALGSPLVAVEGYGSPDAHRVYERARLLCRKLGRPVDPPILRGLGLARLQGCRFDDSGELGRELTDHESDDPVARTEGLYLLGVSAFWRGDLGVSMDTLGRAVESYDEAHLDEHLALYAQDPLAVCLVRLAWARLWAGDTASAEEAARAALERAATLDHPMTSVYVTTYASLVAAESDDVDRLESLLEELARIWTRLPMPYLMILGDALRGWLEVGRGAAEGTETILHSVARSRTEGETLHLTYCLLLLARARAAIGEIRQARSAVREALDLTRSNDQRYLESELLRTEGELAYREGDARASISSLRSAVAVADSQGAAGLGHKARRALADRFPTEADRTSPGS